MPQSQLKKSHHSGTILCAGVTGACDSATNYTDIYSTNKHSCMWSKIITKNVLFINQFQDYLYLFL